MNKPREEKSFIDQILDDDPALKKRWFSPKERIKRFLYDIYVFFVIKIKKSKES